MSFHTAYAYRNKFMNEQEFALFYDANKSINAEFPYWNYERFYLEEKPTKARLSFVFTGKIFMLSRMR